MSAPAAPTAPSLPPARVLARQVPESAQRCIPPEWKLAIGLALFTGVLMSGFFDTLIIQVLGFHEIDRSIRAAMAATIVAFVAAIGFLALARPVPLSYATRRRPGWEWPLRMLFVFTPLWALTGLINDWPGTYIAGDVFMLGIMPATYFVLTRRPLENPRLVFQWLYAMMLLMAVASATLVFYHNLIQGGRHKMSLDAAVLPVYYILLKSNPGWGELLLIPVFILAAIITTKRSTWLALLIVSLLALFLRPGLRRSARLLFAALICAGIGLIVSRERPDWIEHSTDLIAYRWEETVLDVRGGRGSDLASDQGGRMGEAMGVLDTISERRLPVDWALGLGLGAIVEARGGRTRHHVHSTPAAFLARTGIIGLGLWLLFQTSVLMELGRRAFRPPSEWHRVQLLFWLGLWLSATVFSLKSLAFWGSVIGGIQLAYIAHLCRDADILSTAAPSKDTGSA